MKLKKLTALCCVLTTVLLTFSSCLSWIPKPKIYEDGYFQYKMKGDILCIIGFTELGKEQEIIVIPNEYKGYRTGVGYEKMWSNEEHFQSEKLREIYIHDKKPGSIFYGYSAYDTWFIRGEKFPNLEKTSITDIGRNGANEIIFGSTVYFTDNGMEAGKSENSRMKVNHNVCFLMNINDVETLFEHVEEEFYWSEYYEENQLIDRLPPNPEREGYIFDGWYTEPECLNRFDFETMIFSLDENNTLCSLPCEGKLFWAKWVKQ